MLLRSNVRTRTYILKSRVSRLWPAGRACHGKFLDAQTLEGSTQDLQYGLAGGAQDVTEFSDPIKLASSSAMQLEASAAPSFFDQQKDPCLPSRGDASFGQGLLTQAARSRDE